MLYESSIYQMNVDDHVFWVAESKALKGCIGQGETSEKAILELELNEKEWLHTAEEYNIPIPPRTAKIEKKYSGKLSLRISPYLHEVCSGNAENLGISLNQYFNDAIASYNERIVNTFTKQLPQQDNSINKIINISEWNTKNNNTDFSDIQLEEM